MDKLPVKAEKTKREFFRQPSAGDLHPVQGCPFCKGFEPLR